MRPRVALRNIPGRIATGGYIAHAGLGKWRASSERAAGVHGMAAGAYPFLEPVPPAVFVRLLAAGEIVTGALLLNPFTSDAVAGTALTGFSGALLTMYARTPAMHEPRSIWPTPAGMALSKDVWMFGLGVGLLADALTRPRRRRRG
jgi:uncharacterized membrane protein YphA (DoxX/SURF4 family)